MLGHWFQLLFKTEEEIEPPVEPPVFEGGGGVWHMPPRKRAKENDEALLLAVLF